MNEHSSALRNKAEFLRALRQDLLQTLWSVEGWASRLGLEIPASIAHEVVPCVAWVLRLRGPLPVDSVSWSMMSIEEWLAKARQDLNEEVVSTWFNFTPDLLPLQVWGDGRDVCWDNVLRPLSLWLFVGDLKLQSVEWRVDGNWLMAVIRGSGQQVSLHYITERDGQCVFWVLRPSPGRGGFAADSTAAFLLIAQIMARRGGGSLNVEVISEEQIAMELRIPCVDASADLNGPQSSLPEDVLESVLHRVVYMIAAAWRDAGTVLLAALADAFKKMEQSLDRDQEEGVKKLQEGHEKLASLMVVLDSLLSH